MPDKAKSCWTCGHQQIGGPTFLGLCTYFATVGKPNKEIPPNMVNVGCKQWIPRTSKSESMPADSE
jgi:hypothetical protein